MDSNAILAELRALIAAWQAAGSRGPWTTVQADRVVELAADLDRQASRGNLPRAWSADRYDAHRDPIHFGQAGHYARDYGR
jgi:hypothetical protein